MPKLLTLINQRNDLLKEGGDKNEIEKLEITIWNIEAEHNRNKLMAHLWPLDNKFKWGLEKAKKVLSKGSTKSTNSKKE